MLAYWWTAAKLKGTLDGDHDMLLGVLWRNVEVMERYGDVGYMRPEHDMLMAQLVVLSRNEDLVGRAAPLLRQATLMDEPFVRPLALSGIIRNCLLGSARAEHEQAEILLSKSAERT